MITRMPTCSSARKKSVLAGELEVLSRKLPSAVTVLSSFFQGVTNFYHASSERLVKYFKTPLSNRFLSSLTVIDPKCQEQMDLSEQRERWSYLGGQLTHIITEEELGKILMGELPDAGAM